jgi:hypothetical protein
LGNACLDVGGELVKLGKLAKWGYLPNH